MSVEDLCQQLEPLRHVERVQHLLELGRRAAQGEADAQSIVEALATSTSRYQRTLAVATTFGSRDAALLHRLLNDPSRVVRLRAQKAASTLLSDDELLHALRRAASPIALHRLVARLVQKRRLSPVQRFLEEALTANADPRLADLLGHGAPALVESALDEQVRELSLDGLRRLARRHPRLVLEHFEARMVKGLDPRTRYQLLTALAPLARHAPLATLPLAERLWRAGVSHFHVIEALREILRQHPRETFDVLRSLRDSLRVSAMGPFMVVNFDKVVHLLDAERLAYLIEHAPTTLSDGGRARRWFLRLDEAQRTVVIDTWLDRGEAYWGAFLFRHVASEGPHAKRRELAYRRFSAAVQNKEGVAPLASLMDLPRDLKLREGRRHLHDLEALATRTEERIAYAALLPLDEAKEALASFTSHPEGEVRAVAMRALATLPATYPESMSDVLALVASRRFEQDPVRMAMLDALSTLPLRAFSVDVLPALGEVFQHALDAADLSHTTSFHIERLCVRLFRVDATWSAGWLSKLLTVRGVPSSVGLIDGLTPEQARALVPAVSPLCREWADRERAAALIWLARSFGLRLREAPPLVDALVRLATQQPFVHVAAAALDLLKQHAPARFAETFPRLLEADASAIVVPAVARAVSTRRQDLLAPALSGKRMKGRFASGRTHWVVEFWAGYGAWTESQQCAQAELLTKLLKDKKRDVPTLRSGIDSLVNLHFAPGDRLAGFAEDVRPPMREMVVRALARVDDPSSARLLIDALGDERARWAIYALRAILREQPQADAVAILRGAPMHKVTVAKEVIRIAGELGGAAGYEFLVRQDRAALHRDVKIALLRALWDHLSHDETWAAFAEAVEDPDWVVASRLSDVPVLRLNSTSEARITALMVRVLERPEPEARRYLLQRAAHLPLADGDRVLFGACLRHLGAPHQDEVEAAFGAVLQRMDPGEVPQVVARIEELLPQRRTLATLHRLLAKRVGPYAPKHVLAVGDGLLQCIEPDPLLAAHTLALVGALRETRGLVDMLRSFSQRDLLHHDVMEAALEAIRGVRVADFVDQKLRDESDPRLRRLGLGALEHAARPKHGWTRARKERLESYRADPDPQVAAHAAFVFPPVTKR
ncbi:MAG: hypothetical protein R3B13_15040 [Polyangiaceae bacterium]